MLEEPLAPEVFDHLRKATAADPAVLSELCRDYLSEARRTLAQLGMAILQGQPGELRNRAHYLKGSSFVLGAKAVAQSCAALEEKGRNSDFHDVERLLAETRAALDAVEAELARRLGPDVIPSEGSAA